MAPQRVDPLRGWRPAEELRAFALHGPRLIGFRARRLVGPVGAEVTVGTVAVTELQHGRPSWKRLASAASRALPGWSDVDAGRVDPTAAWHCDGDACRVVCPDLGLAAAVVSWTRGQQIASLGFPVEHGGRAVLRRVALTVDTGGGEFPEELSRVLEGFDGTRPGWLVTWPLADPGPRAVVERLGGAPVAWTEPAMRVASVPDGAARLVGATRAEHR